LAVIFFDEEEADGFLAVDLLAAGLVPPAFLALTPFRGTDLVAAECFVDFLAPDAFEELPADVADFSRAFAERRVVFVVLDAFFAVPVFSRAPARLEPITVSVPAPGMTVVSSPESQRT
jgi:hypothetical protein